MSPAGHLLKTLLDIALEALTHGVLKNGNRPLAYDQRAFNSFMIAPNFFEALGPQNGCCHECRQVKPGLARRLSHLQDVYRPNRVCTTMPTIAPHRPLRVLNVMLIWDTDSTSRAMGELGFFPSHSFYPFFLAPFLVDADPRLKGMGIV